MGLIEQLATPVRKRNTSKSRMTEWVEQLPQDEQEAVLTATRNPQWGHVDLLRVFIDAGAPEMSDNAFGVWRRNQGLPRDSH